jgi:DNA polymerase
MNVREEIGDLLGQIKMQLINSQEIGLDAPFLSKNSLNYLKGEPQLDVVPSAENFSCKSLKELEGFISDCDRCKLGKERKNIVFGEGPPDARLVFVGEAPGMEEDLTGKPFVGLAGKLLTDIIKAMGLTRDEVYICNIVKCRPPRNRDPEPDEIGTCLPFLKAQIHEFMGIPLMPTYHPAYLLRYPQAKRQVWEDMQEIMKELGLKDPRGLSD